MASFRSTMAPSVTITGHTTASNPRPHVLYAVKVDVEGKSLTLQKRYSEVLYLSFPQALVLTRYLVCHSSWYVSVVLPLAAD